MPASLAACASALRLHWAEPSSLRATIVPSLCVTNCPGGGWLTNTMIWLSSAAVSRRGRPGLGRSPSPSMPSASKRCRRRRTVCGLTSSSLAMASTRWPSQLPTTMRACKIQSAGPCLLAASLRTQRSSFSSWGARTRKIFGISFLLSLGIPPSLLYHLLRNLALGLTSPGLLEKLTEPLDYPHWQVRLKAIQALGHLRRNIPDAAIRRLLAFRRDPDLKMRAVREAADDALAEILSLEAGIEDDVE